MMALTYPSLHHCSLDRPRRVDQRIMCHGWCPSEFDWLTLTLCPNATHVVCDVMENPVLEEFATSHHQLDHEFPFIGAPTYGSGGLFRGR
jgi:hypothetical protein